MLITILKFYNPSILKISKTFYFFTFYFLLFIFYILFFIFYFSCFHVFIFHISCQEIQTSPLQFFSTALVQFFFEKLFSFKQACTPTGILPALAKVTLPASLFNSSSPFIAIITCLGMIRFFFLAIAFSPASSMTSAQQYSRIAAA